MADLNQVENSSSNPLEQDMEVDQLRIDIEALIQNAKDDPLSQRTWCIYRVPRSIGEKNEDIYTPTTISIGPFHYGDERLKDMETNKTMMLKRFLQRPMICLDDLISFVRDLEPEVRASYSEDITLSRNKFQKLMLLDGAFIIELFLRVCALDDDIRKTDAIFRQPKLVKDITKDLLLLENQLPFFFLEGLYLKAFSAGRVPISFTQLSCMFFGFLNTQDLEPNSDIKIAHFTDLLRLSRLPTPLPGRSFPRPDGVLLYSAKQLAEVGIRFKPRKALCPLDLNFSNNVLDVPEICVDECTAIFLHNMVIFEQYHYPHDQFLSDYAVLWGCLINSHEDVNVLISKGIIHNSLGDPSDVVRIFDGLSTNVTLRMFNSKYSEICRALNYFSRDPRRQIQSALKRQLLLSITGFILNVLTLIQTIFSILQVVRR